MFEWDETKRIKNLQKHGIDFLRASVLFDGRFVYTFPSPQSGENRFLTVGLLEEKFITIVWIPRGNNIRIISARGARNEEKITYSQLYSR
jgi:uncharacterized DUF497 family protein